MPPYLAGREPEVKEFEKLLEQDTILTNLVLTGLRGVGKTVLLDTLKPLALRKGWFWVGTDLSESTSISEENLAIRLLADLAVVTSNITVDTKSIGFASVQEQKLNYAALIGIYTGTPGLVADRLKRVLEVVWSVLRRAHKGCRGVVFAYDEAQNLADHAPDKQFPLSLLLDVFQSIQRRGIPFMLALTGLPTLFPKLVEARTFAERMFRVLFLDRLSADASRDAILKPVEDTKSATCFTRESVALIIDSSAGYPYFIQFICRETFDALIQKMGAGQRASVPIDEILRKLDTDFFSGRWGRATDRQRELLTVIAYLENCEGEFTVQEIVEMSRKALAKPFSPSHVNQMLVSLSDAGLIYKNRHGKYSCAVPLLGRFIRRQMGSPPTHPPA